MRTCFRRLRVNLWTLIGLLVIGFVALQPTIAQAHPLGNFSVNRYSLVEIDSEQITITYVLDMAEIPAFQERTKIDTNGDDQISSLEANHYRTTQTARILDNLRLTLNDIPTELTLDTHELSFPAGQGDLSTLRLTATFTAPLSDDQERWQLDYQDLNYQERLGWQEMVARDQSGVRILDSSVPAIDVTNKLRDYPEDLLQSPLTTTQALVTFEVSDQTVLPPQATDTDATTIATAAPEVSQNADIDFAALIANTASTPYAMGVALLIAFGLGAVHALSPGHGKTIVAAYLVGSRGTTKHALFLGLTTTITHTIGVFALGIITLGVSEFILPEQLYPILTMVSGAAVLLLGLALLRVRWQAFRHSTQANHVHSHTHDDDHDHTHHNHGFGAHSHALPNTNDRASWRNLLVLGISGGLLPCPSALIVLLSAIALDRIQLGLLLIVAFSFGLASILTAIGIALVHVRHLFAILPGRGLSLRVLPLAGSLIVVVFGIGLLTQSLMEIGLVKL
ncbi:MAG: hypothetical protein GFH27_549285n110 [Chloroflexi bacterium AL-W]|nr:hypothetical protein [Chloroflexi bacterium AL-N1]NOK65622.1 hypothetical protein [Chloroflexi bacterium AL-N10]NOK74437.1 hypothetical protein [Chloroflexi bacterium AL-N5]NOK80655.1 hypothetical protein [Chloroflexi bacterium AL-W]NOK88695.1 hypothetical protein [Chloroflexi bacterium AL-N15]